MLSFETGQRAIEEAIEEVVGEMGGGRGGEGGERMEERMEGLVRVRNELRQNCGNLVRGRRLGTTVVWRTTYRTKETVSLEGGL